MELKLDAIQQICQSISLEIQGFQKNLTVYFIVHHDGQRLDALSMAAQEILEHPASDTAMQFLQKPGRYEGSSLLGTAVARQNIFFGLTTRDHLLALCTLNIDQFETPLQAKLHAYHLAWHVLDIAHYHQANTEEYYSNDNILLRHRQALALTSDNLQADIFAAAMCCYHKSSEAPIVLAQMRSQEAITRKTHHTPEHYPFALAMDTVQNVFDPIAFHKAPKKKFIQNSLTLARQITFAFDEKTLQRWLAFCEPAQDLAWRNMPPEIILSAAINTSADTHVRAHGYTLAEILKITPSPITDIQGHYSPFADSFINEKLHNKMIDYIKQDVIAKGISQNSPIPLLRKANEQNADLSLGKTLGWCANALQAAAQAFETARKSGIDSASAVRHEFEGQRHQVSWEDIDEVGKRVVQKNRGGDMVTLSEIEKLAADLKGLEDIKESLAKTMADPAYQYKIAAAAELDNVQGLQPIGPAPSVAPKAMPQSPVMEAAPAMGLGGAPQTAKQPLQKTPDQGIAAKEKASPEKQETVLEIETED